MRVLFDQGTPAPLRQFLQGHTVNTAAQKRWNQLRNGELLNAAEAAGFDVLVTTDKNLRHEQNLRGRRIVIVVLSTPRWPVVRLHIEKIATAVNAATTGSYAEVQIPIE
jgi:predicted nuclease of predicted toxin-antitoxin system